MRLRRVLVYYCGRVAMPRLLFPAVVVAILLAAGCGDTSPPPSNPDPGNGTGGGGRLAWTQPGAPSDVSTYQYALYVDGERRVLQGAGCNPSASDGSDCTAPVPPLGPGRHVLQLAAFVVSDDTVIEGPRSASLEVNSPGATAPSPPAASAESGEFAASDGLPLHADVLADDLVAPSDLAVAPDGRLFVAERGGVVRIMGTAGSDVSTGTQNVLRLLGEDETPGASALLSITIDRAFEKTGYVHVAYSARERDRTVVRTARLREVAGTLGEAAAIATLPVQSAPQSAIVRTGPDGMLYVAIDSLSDPDAAQRLSEVAGKLLRIAPDGSTPDGNGGSSPVLSSGHRDPRGLAWRADGSLWEIERDESGDELNRIASGANYGWPRGPARGPRPDAARPAMLLPAGTAASGLASVAADGHPLNGALIVAAADAQDLLVVRIGADAGPRVASRMLDGRYGRIGQVAAAADGSLYFLTANGADTGQFDALIRLRTADR